MGVVEVGIVLSLGSHSGVGKWGDLVVIRHFFEAEALEWSLYVGHSLLDCWALGSSC